MKVELVYEQTCPNIEAARLALLSGFAAAGLTPRWQEWEVSMPDAPAHVHGYGSPTILVNGRDVAGGPVVGDDYCCRVYAHGTANKGVPAVADIERALRSAQPDGGASRWRLNGAMLPTVGTAFLPKLACPACWPAYAGLLSSLGIGFFDYTPYLLPLTASFLILAVAALAWRAPRRRGYKPLLLGLLGSGILLTGRFHFDNDVAMYLGLTLLVAASLWNTWPKSRSAGAPCPTCVPPDQEPMRDT